MFLSVLAAQFPISFSIKDNLETILGILDQAQPGDLVAFPEGAISGYSINLSFLDKINHRELKAALELLGRETSKREIFLWVGACFIENEKWINAGFGFMPNDDTYIYRKINLAHHERGTFAAGADLPVFQMKTQSGVVSIGVQLCRELRFPEQWRWLSQCGTQVILHLNNATGDDTYQPVWRSHLISRAAENQRFVISVNNAAPQQMCPTMIIAPNGQVIDEVVSAEKATLHATLDLSLVSDWYLSQSRTDVIELKPSKNE